MSYRIPDGLPHKPVTLFDDSAVEVVINVDNGTISRIAIPCSYSYWEPNHRMHRMIDDHIGWPSPDNPDASSQEIPRRLDRFQTIEDIDLEAEGYDSVEISLVDPPIGLEVSGSISIDLVNLTITSMCPMLIKDDADVKFSAYIIGSTEGYGRELVDLRDVIAKGVIHVVAGPIG